MVKINTVKAANAAFINRQPLTAVFVGATGGIGEATVRQLCKIHGSGGPGHRIIIVGRNTIAAQRIIEECKQAGPHVEICFVHAGDISLLRNVDQACIKVTEILKSSETAQVDMLIMSQGKVEFGGRISEFLSYCLYNITDAFKTQRRGLTNRCLYFTTLACGSSQSSCRIFFPPLS